VCASVRSSAERADEVGENRAAIGALRQECAEWDAREIDEMTSINNRVKEEETRRSARIAELQQAHHEINHLKQLPMDEALQRADEYACVMNRLQNAQDSFVERSRQPIVPLASIHPAVKTLRDLHATRLLHSLSAQATDALRGFLRDRGVYLVRIHTTCTQLLWRCASSQATNAFTNVHAVMNRRMRDCCTNHLTTVGRQRISFVVVQTRAEHS
jgi:hypothetical protein